MLNRTYLYPQGGGQIYDTGTTSNIRVVSIRREGDFIIHRLESEPTLEARSSARWIGIGDIG